MPNNQSFLPFALPDIGDEECAAVLATLKSGWVTTGPTTKLFEIEFGSWLGEDMECIAVNSATAGLHLALESVGVAPGDEVITSPHTFTATAEVVRYLGAHPVFVDIDHKTLNIDPKKIEQAITPKTKAIIPVHFAGLACDNSAILKIAANHGLHVIEDAAHALPCRDKNGLIGTLKSDFTVFSFYATKTITTGEGGMIVTRNKEFAQRCRTMRLHGISRDAFDRYTSNAPSWYYEVVAPGFKYNLSDIASSIGIEQLKKAHKFQTLRQSIAKRYNNAFQDLPIILPPDATEAEQHSWHLYVIRLKKSSPVSRDDFIDKMFKSGIGCSVHFIPLHLHPYWRDTYNLKTSDLPESTLAYKNSISLPIYTKMTADNTNQVINAVRDILNP